MLIIKNSDDTYYKRPQSARYRRKTPTAPDYARPKSARSRYRYEHEVSSIASSPTCLEIPRTALSTKPPDETPRSSSRGRYIRPDDKQRTRSRPESRLSSNTTERKEYKPEAEKKEVNPELKLGPAEKKLFEDFIKLLSKYNEEDIKKLLDTASQKILSQRKSKQNVVVVPAVPPLELEKGYLASEETTPRSKISTPRNYQKLSKKKHLVEKKK